MSEILESKICKTCGLNLPLSEYHAHKETLDKKRSSCKKCRNKENKERWPKSKEKGRAQAAKWASKNPDRKKASFQDWYYRNRQSQIERAAKYKMSEAGKATQKRFLEKNRDRILANRKRLRDNPTIRQALVKKLRDRFYKVTVRMKQGKKFTSSIDLIGCTIEELKTHLQSQFTEGMNWSNHGFGPDKWTIDHIMPLANFDLFDFEQQKIAFHYTNLQPLWGIDNFRKSDRVSYTKQSQ